MRWQGRESSTNVEDRRGMRKAAPMMGGGLLFIVIGALITYLMGGNPAQFVQQQVEQQKQQAAQVEQLADGPREDEPLFQMSSVVLRDTEVVWQKLFPTIANGRPYNKPKMVIYDANVETRGCGEATSAAGPFYCGADDTVYIDLAFFKELRTRFKAPGEFACAYVIAHEVGHHVQNELGLLREVQMQRDNKTLVRLELQADFLAGVWAHHAHKQFQILEPGDIESGINAAKQVGDDTIMKNAGIRPVPDSFTHGTSEQRMRWFVYGLKTGEPHRMNECFDLPYEQL